MNIESHWQCEDFRRLGPLHVRSVVRLKAVGGMLAFMAVAGLAMAQDQAAAPDCQCRSPDGQMRDLGTVQCVDIVGRKSLVRCEMSTNTPYWKKVEGVAGCPDA